MRISETALRKELYMYRWARDKKALFFFAFPGLFLYTVFVVFPLIPEIIISFQDHNGVISKGFVGLKNYVEIFTNQRFWTANKNVILIALSTLFIGLPISLALAIIIDMQNGIVRRIFKTICFIPAVLSVTIISQLWIAIYNPQWGLLNGILKRMGLDRLTTAWLSNESTALICVMIVFMWQYLGFNMVLFYAGIKAIPKVYYEAALIDGAGPIKASLKITFPLLQDVLKYVLTISLLGSIGMYLHVQMLTNGGPGDVTTTVVLFMYNTAFRGGDFGEGCAIAIIYIMECVFISCLINKFVAKEAIEF